jgi:ribosomal protein S4E
VGDSVVIANAKIEKTIPLKIGANIIVMDGKSAGTRGIVERIEGAFAAISSQKEKHIIPLKNIMALQHGK